MNHETEDFPLPGIGRVRVPREFPKLCGSCGLELLALVANGGPKLRHAFQYCGHEQSLCVAWVNHHEDGTPEISCWAFQGPVTETIALEIGARIGEVTGLEMMIDPGRTLQ